MCTDKKRKLTRIKNIVNIYKVLHRTVYIHRVYTEFCFTRALVKLFFISIFTMLNNYMLDILMPFLLIGKQKVGHEAWGALGQKPPTKRIL